LDQQQLPTTAVLYESHSEKKSTNNWLCRCILLLVFDFYAAAKIVPLVRQNKESMQVFSPNPGSFY
jgi:hypothetical protein